MRPDVRQPVRDFVFRSADNSTAAELALEVRNAVAAVGAAGRRPRRAT